MACKHPASITSVRARSGVTRHVCPDCGASWSDAGAAMKNFGIGLRVLRETWRLPDAKLIQAGISLDRFEKVCAGRVKANLEDFVRIADAFEVSMTSLIRLAQPTSLEPDRMRRVAESIISTTFGKPFG